MSEPLSQDERSKLHDEHFAVRQGDGTTYLCDSCGRVWPCYVKRLLRDFEELFKRETGPPAD